MAEPGGSLHLCTQDVLWREVGDEVLVLKESTGMYFSLNAVGRELWNRLESGGATQADLATWLAERYDIPADQAEQDVATFIGQLREKQLLEEAQG